MVGKIWTLKNVSVENLQVCDLDLEVLSMGGGIVE